MTQATLLLGSNVGDSLEYLRIAVKQIEARIGKVMTASSIYETQAWGFQEQPSFLNQVVTIDSALEPVQVLYAINDIENELGRQRIEKWASRTIDIDILYYDNLIFKSSDLTIPHPELHNRRFTLVPLVEIDPDFVHPILKKSNLELLEMCEDVLKVKKLVGY